MAAFFTLACVPASTASAAVAAADTNGSYSTQVLAQFLRVWREPESARGTAVAQLSIAPSGALAGCAICQSSGNARLDASVCSAAQNAAPFPYAPFGAEAVVSLAVSCGEVSQKGAAPQNYAEMLRQSISPRIRIPKGLAGTWTTVVRIDVWADGSIKDCRIIQASGNAQADAAVMEAVQSPGAITPPPVHAEQSATLSFTLSAR